MSQATIPQNILLVSENKLRSFTDIDQNVTSSVLLPFIAVVQQTKLEYIIGGLYYRTLLNEVSGNTLTTINYNFLNYFVQPLLIWAAYAEALPSIFMRIKNNGIVNGAENTVTIKEMEFLQQRADDRSQFFEQRMIEEIIFNSNNYPQVFNWTNNGLMQPHLGKNYFSGIHLSNGQRYASIENTRFPGMVFYADPSYYCCGL